MHHSKVFAEKCDTETVDEITELSLRTFWTLLRELSSRQRTSAGPLVLEELSSA